MFTLKKIKLIVMKSLRGLTVFSGEPVVSRQTNLQLLRHTTLPPKAHIAPAWKDSDTIAQLIK